jgi:O-antigen/teichoic acid export membrane protein
MSDHVTDDMGVKPAITSSSADKSGFGDTVKTALFWRSGSQILAQILTWGSTLAVIRILDPSDYGLFAMSQTLLAFLAFLNGYGFASSLIQSENVSRKQIRQAFGLLILLNMILAIAQIALAPIVATYYQEPIVANMLWVQALIYLATPFIVIPEVLMSRQLDFKRQAIVNLIAAIIGAVVALVLALSDWGVWALVFAPISLFWTRAIGLTLAGRFFYMPSFDFRGTGAMISFGSAMLIGHLFWVIQSQSSIFIAGRFIATDALGIYATALFLAQIFATKFIPPLNAVAFPAYAQLQNDPSRLSWSFLKAVRLILLVSCPLYIGLSVTANELVHIVFVEKWFGMGPLLQIISLAMPFMTLQILFGPALNALGKPQITMRNAMFGAIIMSATFGLAVQFGTIGMAYGWLIAFPLLTAFTFWQAHRWINISALQLLKAMWPAASASTIMGVVVYLVGAFLLPGLSLDLLQNIFRFGVMVAIGGLVYVLTLRLLLPETLSELIRLVIKRKPPQSGDSAAGA